MRSAQKADADPTHVTHVNFANGFRGGERQTLNLIEGLTTKGTPQLLVCRAGSELQARAQAIGCATRGLAHPLLGHLRVAPTALIHAHEARAVYWAALERTLRGTPYLITRRIPNAPSNSAVNRYVHRRAAERVSVSSHVAQRLGVSSGRSSLTILDSCSALPVDPAKTAALRTFFGPGPVIGHVGALQDHHKGQSVLIHAFLRLARTRPDARLVLVGEGPDRAWLERLASGDQRIVFAGFQPSVGDWFAAFDVFAFPSREEGLGSSVLDAMLMGIPVMSSTAGGLPELSAGHLNSIMVQGFDPSDWAIALDHLLGDPDIRTRLVENAHRFARAHDVEAMTSSYAAVYREVVSATHRSACPPR